MNISQQRKMQIDGAIKTIKGLCAEDKITRYTLAKIETIMLGLVKNPELFPKEEFGIPVDEKIRLYRLAEDDDGGFALYLHVAQPNAEVGPHNHTTWACIAGIEGEERNFFYETQSGSAPTHTGTSSVRKGEAISLLADDVHSIKVVGKNPLRNLHLYGKAIDQLYDRVFWDSDNKRWSTTPPTSGIIEKRL